MDGLNLQTPEPLNAPLLEMIDNCSQCLSLSQDFASITLPSTDINETDPDNCEQNEKKERELDLTALENFLTIRADIFALAQSSLNQVRNQPLPDNVDPSHRELAKRAINILEEMAKIEENLTTYFSERLSKIKSNILKFKQSKPIFKRYANLGSPNQPNCISRHE